MPIRFLLPLVCLLAVAQTVRADDRPPADGEAVRPVDYLRDVKPLLARRCTSCHGSLRQQSGLRLDAGTLVHRGGDSGPAVVPGRPDESLLIDAVTGRGGFPLMPKEGGPLSKDEIALLERWIAEGAASPENEPIEADPREHWAFRVPERPPVPVPDASRVRDSAAVDAAAWPRNPVDAFLAAEREPLGLPSAAEAPKHVLLRRVYLDLIGLPPTLDELREFLADDSPAAYEKVIDRLLASPHHGERWGRHWMDVWRYSDWYGYGNELRNSARHIWRWRDWIVESLNADRPYDRMVVEMLAADELAPTDRDTLRATGYLVRSYYKFNRHTWLDATIEHTGKAFLGLTINCARCHDHMYDPISQREYYEFRAIFEPHHVRTDRVPGEADLMKDGLPRAFDAHLDTQTFLFERGNDKHPDQDPLSPGVPEAVASAAAFAPETIELPVEAWYPGFERFVQDEALEAVRAEVAAREAELEKLRAGTDESPDAQAAASVAESRLTAARAALAAVEARLAADRARFADPPAADADRLAGEAAGREREAALRQAEASVAAAELDLARAERKALPDGQPDEKAARDARAKLESARKSLEETRRAVEKADAATVPDASSGRDSQPGYKPFSDQYLSTSTGRRLALARWITDRRNPLTARVAVNHVWLRHFGSPLVPSVFDFGRNGSPPTHPALLDWLAVELASSEDGAAGAWRTKRLHRLLVTSAAYRLASTAPEEHPGWTADRDNRLLWRMNPRRMEAEVVRDSVLAAADGLDRRMGGPEIDEKQAQTVPRRSLYFRHAPEKHAPFLSMFDSASTNECYRRVETVVPQQALAMTNSRLTREQSRQLARALGDECDPAESQPTEAGDAGDGSDTPEAAFITAAFERILCRPPTAAEVAACTRFLSEQSARLSDAASLTPVASPGEAAPPPAADPRRRARENLIHVLLNHNEFITIR